MKAILILFLLIFNPNIFISATSSGYDYSSYSATSTNTNLSSQTISCTTSGQSAVYITSSGITISDSTITKSGDFSGDTEDSEFYGLNAAILVQGGELTMTGGTITNSAKVSNALVATNDGTVTISRTTITSTGGSSARGLHATYGGKITATDVTISSTGGSCATLATDRGEGTVTCTGCTLSTAGSGSPLIYSTGDITVSSTTGTSSKAQAVVVEGKNSATIQSSSDLKCTGNGNGRDDDCGILIYQSMSGDADTGTSTFTCDSSTIEILSTSSVYSSAPFFYVTNTDANINIKDCTLKFGSGQFMLIDEGDWGTSGSNGGSVTMTLTNQDIEGDIVVGSSSSLTLTLVNSSIKGTINADKTASKLDITLDADSTITLTGNSYYTSLTNSDSDNSNIISGSYSWTSYDESSSTSTSGSQSSSGTSPSGSSSGGTPPDKPGSDQAEPGQSGTPPDKPGSDQAEPDQSGTPPEKPGSDQPEPDQSGTPPEKPSSDQAETQQNTTVTNKVESSDGETSTNTTSISATIPNTSANSASPSTTKAISTVETTETPTSSNQTNNTISSPDASVVLLGYSDYQTTDTSFSFFIYFASLLNSISSRTLRFPINIQYNSALRHLDDKESVCTLQGSGSESKLQYKCEVQADTPNNIKQISIQPNFNFEGQNVNLAGTTSLADNYMDKIQNANDLNYLSNSNIYILDHSIYEKGSGNSFSLSGEISDPQPTFAKNDLILQISSEGNKEINVSCTINNVSGKNYTLNCSPDENINSDDLQSAYSNINNDILLVNIDKDNSTNTPEETDTAKNGFRYNYKNSQGLGAGGIVAIVLASVAAIGILAALVALLSKSKAPAIQQNYPQTSNLQINPEVSN